MKFKIQEFVVLLAWLLSEDETCHEEHAHIHSMDFYARVIVEEETTAIKSNESWINNHKVAFTRILTTQKERYLFPRKFHIWDHENGHLTCFSCGRPYRPKR